MTQRQMSGGGRLKRTKSFPAGRVCEGDDCSTRLSIYNPDHLCSRCDDDERLEQQEFERLGRLLVADAPIKR